MEIAEQYSKITVTNGNHPMVQKAFQKVRKLILMPEENNSEVDSYIDRMFMYNVLHGKFQRLLQVVQTFESMSQEPITPERLEEACILGWVMELIQACAVVLDDVMDKSETRRGRMCWYLLEDVGLKACNDSLMFLMSSFTVIRKTFGHDQKLYFNLTETLSILAYQLSRGQCLDMLKENSTEFDEKTYELIATYKTSLYCFSLPVRFGMYLSGIDDPNIHKSVEEIAIEIGILFQIQDDFLDVFGDSEVTGKIGTDIIDGKYSWILIKALQLASPVQKETILSNIKKGAKGGREEQLVKQIYQDLRMEEVFREFETKKYEELHQEIEQLKERCGINTEVLSIALKRIYKRNK